MRWAAPLLHLPPPRGRMWAEKGDENKMDEIKISVKQLYERAKQMLDDGMDTVILSILTSDEDENVPIALSLEAAAKDTPYEGVDYDEIEAVS